MNRRTEWRGRRRAVSPLTIEVPVDFSQSRAISSADPILRQHLPPVTTSTSLRRELHSYVAVQLSEPARGFSVRWL
eukprot:COSAG01_NODE_30953_length_606_cov_1.613412_1_plen_76_part_00